jgi:hypothetical protein
MFDRPRTSLPILALLLILPQNIYVIGDYLAVGIRFPFFRYQLTFQSISGPGDGTATDVTMSTITVARELQYIFVGVIRDSLGKTAFATYIWLAGLVVLVLAAVLVISWQLLDNEIHAPYPGPLILVSGGLFLVWGMVQFGPLLYGPSGYTLPVGLPAILYTGYRFLQDAREEEEQVRR